MHHCFLARPAGVLGPMRHDHTELGRDHVEPLGRILADHMHGGAAARAIGVFGRNRHMNARQMGGKRAAIGLALLGTLARPHSLHIHIVVGTRDGSAKAGILAKGHVRPTLEVVVTESPARRKVKDTETGLALIRRTA